MLTTVQIEGLFSRDSKEDMAKRDVSALSDIIKTAPSLSADDKQTIKTALMNKIGTLQNVSQRGFAADIGGAAVGGASGALIGNLLSEVRSITSCSTSDLAEQLCADRETLPS